MPNIKPQADRQKMFVTEQTRGDCPQSNPGQYSDPPRNNHQGSFKLPACLLPKKNTPPLTWRDFILLPVFFGLFIYVPEYLSNYLKQYEVLHSEIENFRFFLNIILPLLIMFLYRKKTTWREFSCLFILALLGLYVFLHIFEFFSIFPSNELLVFLPFWPFLILRWFKVVASNIYFLFSYSFFSFWLTFLIACFLVAS